MALTRGGWPWWTALPAAILITVAVFMGVVVALYAYAKWANPGRVARIRERMLAGQEKGE